MNAPIRFSGFVRKGLKFREKFEKTKRLLQPQAFSWYPYDCFANLFFVQRLLNDAGLSLENVIGPEPVLDLGAADGALSFFLESLGHEIHACDYFGTNINRMQGIRTIAAERISIRLSDVRDVSCRSCEVCCDVKIGRLALDANRSVERVAGQLARPA